MAAARGDARGGRNRQATGALAHLISAIGDDGPILARSLLCRPMRAL
jgi:hypothetical protein